MEGGNLAPALLASGRHHSRLQLPSSPHVQQSGAPFCIVHALQQLTQRRQVPCRAAGRSPASVSHSSITKAP